MKTTTQLLLLALVLGSFVANASYLVCSRSNSPFFLVGLLKKEQAAAACKAQGSQLAKVTSANAPDLSAQIYYCLNTDGRVFVDSYNLSPANSEIVMIYTSAGKGTQISTVVPAEGQTLYAACGPNDCAVVPPPSPTCQKAACKRPITIDFEDANCKDIDEVAIAPFTWRNFFYGSFNKLARSATKFAFIGTWNGRFYLPGSLSLNKGFDVLSFYAASPEHDQILVVTGFDKDDEPFVTTTVGLPEGVVVFVDLTKLQFQFNDIRRLEFTSNVGLFQIDDLTYCCE